MTFFENAIYALEGLGIADVLLPFLLIFTVSYVALYHAVPLFKDQKPYAITLAFVFALAAIFPHVTGEYGYGIDAVEVINESLPFVGIWMVVGLSILLLLGLFGWELKATGTFGGILALCSFVVVFYIFGESARWFEDIYILDWIGPDIQALLLVLGIFILFVMFITGGFSSGGTTLKEILENIVNRIT